MHLRNYFCYYRYGCLLLLLLLLILLLLLGTYHTILLYNIIIMYFLPATKSTIGFYDSQQKINSRLNIVCHDITVLLANSLLQ